MDADEELAARLVRETEALRRVARGVLFEPALAEDAVQETWLAALQQPARASGGWLTESVRRIALGLRRREARVHRREQRAARPEEQPAADETAERVDALRQIVRALDDLEEPYRSAVRLRYLDDLPIADVARRLAVPQETVRTRLRRGLALMRSRLDANNSERRDAFLAAFAPLALGAGGALKAAALSSSFHPLGGALVSTQTKLAAAALVAVFAFVGWRFARTTGDSPRVIDHQAAPPAELALSVEPRAETAEESATNSTKSTERAAVASAAAPAAEWTARGRATLGAESGFAQARLRVTVVAGYEGEGESLLDEVLVADSSGAFEFGLARPNGAVRIRVQRADPNCISWAPTTLVPTDAPPPQDLFIRLYPLDVRVAGRVLDVDGRPLADARVAGFSDAVDCDEDGRFELYVPSLFRQPRLDAWCDGYALRTTILESDGHAELEAVEIRLERCALLRGRVVDEFEAPIENAKVRGGFSERSIASTDARGEFALDHLDDNEGVWVVRVSAEGYAPLQVQLDGPEEREKPLKLKLERGLDLAGRVVDGGGAPLRGATVYAGFSPNSDAAVNAVSHDDGRFVLRNVSREEVRVGAQLAGYAPCSIELRLPERGVQTSSIELVLGRGVVLRGRVADSEGAPVASASVYVETDGEFGAVLTAKSEADGSFEVRGVPAQAHLELNVSATGYRYAMQAVADIAAKQAVVLERAAELAGRVVDAMTGAPIRRFRVRFVAPQLEPGERALYGYTSNWIEEGVLFDDEHGVWRTGAESLPVGCVTGVEIRAAGYGPLVLPRAVARFDAAPEQLVASLGPGAAVSGVVLDSSTGPPLNGALVRVLSERDRARGRRPQGADVAATRTDALGRFAFDALARETLWLVVDATGFAPALDGPIEMPASGDPAPRTISLSVGGVIVGRLLSADGAPRAREVVRIDGLGMEHSLDRDIELVTDADGRFRAAGLVPGEHQVSVALEHERGTEFDLARTVDVREGREIPVDLRPGGNARLVGRLTSTATLPAEVPITLRRKSGEGECSSLWRSAIARGGHFEVDGLEPGVWNVSAGLQLPTADRKFLTGSTEVELVADSEAACGIDLALLR